MSRLQNAKFPTKTAPRRANFVTFLVIFAFNSAEIAAIFSPGGAVFGPFAYLPQYITPLFSFFPKFATVTPKLLLCTPPGAHFLSKTPHFWVVFL
jgi:hypothetical protein